MKTVRAALLGAAMVMSGCATQYGNIDRPDDHRFSYKEFEHLDVEVHVVLLQDAKEFRDAARAHGLKRRDIRSVTSAYTTEAWATFVPSEQECTIYIKDPNWRFEPTTYGHELAHCLWGRWHAERK